VSRYQASAAGKGSNRREGKGFEENFDKIFKGKPQRGRFIQDPKTHKMVPAEDYISQDTTGQYAAIHAGFDAFVSPVDGQVIDDRRKLREHNKRHGVTNSADYSNGYIEDRARKRNAEGQKQLKQTRQADVTHMVDRILNR
jgi:hypothetical protein